MSTRGGPEFLLAVALVLLLTGFSGSAVFWVASGGEAFLAVQEGYGEAIAAAGSDAHGLAQPSSSERAERQWQRVNRAARLVEMHAHLLFLCIFLLLFALLLGGSGKEARARHLAWLATGGVVVYPFGLALQALGAILAGQILSAVGAGLILLFAGIVTAGLLRSQEGVPESGDSPRE